MSPEGAPKGAARGPSGPAATRPRAGSDRPSPGGGLLGLRHQRVQRLRRLITQSSFRASERAFVLEGNKLLSEALDAGAALEGLYLAPGEQDPVVDRAVAAGVRAHHLAPGVLERVAGTVTPQPVLAVAASVGVGLDALKGADLVVVCVDVRDPGNLGTILRSAEASGSGGVVCCDGTADVYNPKTVRASAGSLFHVQVVTGGRPADVLGKLGEWGVYRLATRPAGGKPYDQVDFSRACAVVVGNESAGLPSDIDAHVDAAVSIPISGHSESLNVGMAAAVVCFEAARQRRARSLAR